MRILYVGQLQYGATSLQRFNDLKELGHEITGIPTATEEIQTRRTRLIDRILRKVLVLPDYGRINDAIQKQVDAANYDILWLDKGVDIRPATLRYVRESHPHTLIVGFSPDTMSKWFNQSWAFRGSLHLYHVYLTPKSFDLEYFRKKGIGGVYYVLNGYNIETHAPLSVSSSDQANYGSEIGFVGHWEKERSDALKFLARKGYRVRVWGPGWKREKHIPKSMTIEHRNLAGIEYAKALSSFTINVAFLRKRTGDLHTTRTFEIPAVGGFMLAERSSEHEALFIDGVEAVFFSTQEELAQKVEYYLKHPDIRQRIARAGRERCLESGYSFRKQLQKIWPTLEKHHRALSNAPPSALRA